MTDELKTPATIVNAQATRRAPWTHDPSGPCEHCKSRPAKTWWSGEASWLDVVRGAAVEAWCERCCVTAQLEHCRKQAERIPALECELAALENAERSSG